ncbi:PilZ domain-containing protein [Myxococcota bacterium]
MSVSQPNAINSVRSTLFVQEPQQSHSSRVSWPVQWSAMGTQGPGQVLDVTPQGLSLSAQASLQVGQRVHLQFSLSGQGGLSASGTVRSQKSLLGGYRVEFDTPDLDLFVSLWKHIA